MEKDLLTIRVTLRNKEKLEYRNVKAVYLENIFLIIEKYVNEKTIIMIPIPLEIVNSWRETKK